MKKLTALFIVVMLAVPFSAFALSNEEIEKEIGNLKQQVNELSKDNEKLTKRIKSSRSPISISGDYQFRIDVLEGTVPDYFQFNEAHAAWMMTVMAGNTGAMPPAQVPGYKVENDELYTNKFGLNIAARATKDINVKARLVMYKTWGHQSSDPVLSGYFADRYSNFDGTASHVPQDSVLRVDQAFASWSGIGGSPVWFSVGRRPSTGGVPTNLKRNVERSGASGTPGILVDYAFDGMVFGVAPDIEALPGAYAKLCYGKGLDGGFAPASSELEDVKMIGLDMAVYDTEAVRVEMQYNKASDIFAMPDMVNGNINMGDIQQFGVVVTGKAANINWFASAATSKTSPNDEVYVVMLDMDGDGTAETPMPMAGLMYDYNPMAADGGKESTTGNAFYLGARYDLDSGWKFGAEYNKGSENWITFTPAAEDMITSKLGTRGTVTELYIIKDLNQEAVSRKGRAFFKLGLQDYTFDYTGSNNWIGAPKDMDDMDNPMAAQMMPPISEASNMYFTYNVEF